MTIVEQIHAELTAFNEKKVALTETLRKDFPSLLAPLFDANPSVEKISWTQYTPYFNDGESCEFCAQTDYIIINGEDKYDSENIEKSVFVSFSSVLESIPYEFYLELFGDHVEITIKKDGTIKVDEYEHD